MGVSNTTFQKGQGGRKPGSVNKLTKTVRETVLATFNDLQEKEGVNLTDWAVKNPRDFYQIAAKLIPTEITGDVTVKNKQVFEINGQKIEFE